MQSSNRKLRYSLLPTNVNSVDRSNFIRSKRITQIIVIIFVFLILLSISTQWPTVKYTEDCLWDFRPSSSLESVSCHHRRAKEIWNSRQNTSRSYESAARVYRERYNREPPKGFRQWFQFALKHDVRNIDNYDTVHATLKQFRHLSSTQMRSNLNLITGWTNQLKTYSVTNGTLVYDDKWHGGLANNIGDMLKPIVGFLPDLQFVINWDDLEALFGAEHEGMDQLTKAEAKHDDKWALMTASCPNDLIGRTSLELDRPSINLCQHLNSSRFIRQRREFFKDAAAMKNRVPVFSWSKFSTSRDILIPYWASATNGYRNWDLEDKLAWENKNDTIFWRASTTGSPMQKGDWHLNHRLQVGQYFNDVRSALRQIKEHRLSSAETSSILGDLNFEDSRDNRALLSRLNVENFDAGLASFSQCPEIDRACSFVGRYIPLLGKVNGVAAERNSKIVFDMDGNSMSARFYRQLDSYSLVFKNTLMAEFHDDFLIPWFHYIPIDVTSPHQIVQLVDFFLNNDKGRKIAAEIARNGKKMADTMLRPIDFSIYWYRLLLEYNALF